MSEEQQPSNTENSEVKVPHETRGFSFHYDNLERIAQELAQQEHPDLDVLIPLVDEALESYAQVQQRVRAVQALLDSRKLKVHDDENETR